MKPWEIRRLTDRQIVELYFHPRTEEGEIEPVASAPKVDKKTGLATLSSELMGVDLLVANHIIGTADGDRLKQQLRDKYAKLSGAGHG